LRGSVIIEYRDNAEKLSYNSPQCKRPDLPS